MLICLLIECKDNMKPLAADKHPYYQIYIKTYKFNYIYIYIYIHGGIYIYIYIYPYVYKK